MLLNLKDNFNRSLRVQLSLNTPPSLGSFKRRPQLRGEATSKLSISGGNEASLEGLATPPNGHGEFVRRLRRETITFSALHVRLYGGFPIGFSESGICLI